MSDKTDAGVKIEDASLDIIEISREELLEWLAEFEKYEWRRAGVRLGFVSATRHIITHSPIARVKVALNLSVLIRRENNHQKG